MKPVRRARDRALVAIAAAALGVACRAEAPAPPSHAETIAPGAAALQPPPLGDRTVSFRWEASPASDTVRAPIPVSLTEISHQTMRDSGGPALRQIIRVASNPWTDTLFVDRTTLAPLRERARSRGRTIAVDYDGARVRWTTTAGDSILRRGDSTYARPVFAFNQLEMVVRSLPLRVGYTAVVPFYSEGTPEVELDTLSVVSAPTTDAAGAWTIRFADSAIVSHYRLSAATRDILGVEVVLRTTGTRFTRVPGP